MKTKHVNPSRLLPKTQQVTPATAGTDGYYQAGWWKGRDVDTNKTRFIAQTIDGDDVIIDMATGLMWAADGNEAGCNNGATITWDNGLVYAELLDFAGFTDWRMPIACSSEKTGNIIRIVHISSLGLSMIRFPFLNNFGNVTAALRNSVNCCNR